MSLNTRVAAIFGAAAMMLAGVLATDHEGIRYKAYQDGGGVWTICRGHTKDVRPGDTATQEQCDAWFREDLAAANDAFNACVQEPVSPYERAAYVDLLFNIGAPRFCGSTLVKKLGLGDRQGACIEISRWVYANGKDCRLPESNCLGIVKRRQDERELCLMGLN